MGIHFPWDTPRRIAALESIPNRTPRQEDRLQKLRMMYVQGQKASPSLSYPSVNTRTSREDTFFKTKEEQARVMSQNINLARPTFSRSNLGAYHNLLAQEDWETNEDYYKRLVDTFGARVTNLDKTNTIYNPTPTKGFFPQASSVHLGQKTFTSLDIETDDYGHPLSVIAHKFIQGPDGKFQAVGDYQRYYKTHGWNVRSTQAVHGFTPAVLKSLRNQQGATYGETYRGQEIEDLKSFLGDSIIVGHNIGEFDLQKLFPEGGIHNSTIDTLVAARNAWKGAKNSLDHVYHRIFGRTMEQDGLYHHDANADVIASMRIMEAMAKDKGHVGMAMRYIMNAEMGYQLAEYEPYLGSMIAKGDYKAGKGKNRSNLHEVYMKAEDYGLMEYDEDGNKMYVNGYHEEIPITVEEMAAAQELEEAKQEALEWQNKLKQKEGARSLKKKKNGSNDEWLSNSVAEQELFQEFNQFNNYKRLSLVSRLTSAKSQESIAAIRRAAGYSAGDKAWGTIEDMAQKMKMGKQYDKIEQYVDDGLITSKQASQLKSLYSSYEDLVDATNDVIKANERLRNTYRAISEIKPYDINSMLGAAQGQWSGIKGAARGVVPGFILNPISRLGDAALNSLEAKLAPWNAVQRIWSSTAGKVLGGATGSSTIGGAATAVGHPGWGTGVGIFNAGTQVAGNIMQAGIEVKGLNIQNSLNTLGAMISWVATPFQLLHKATKLLLGSFTGLSYKLNSFMSSGIGLMSQMGNPLTELTGVNYSTYAGSTMMDIATLSGKGTMNSIYEDYAMQQQGLLFGNLDTQRMIAASMLGTFDSVYMQRGNTKETYNAMANKLLSNMQYQSPEERVRTMYLAGQIDKNLPQLLRTANLLGVTDVNQLADPTSRGMYWNAPGMRNPDEPRNFRWTQYEYNAAKEQFGYSKMRFANSLWNAGGKKIYNVFNELVDTAASGNWEAAIKRASEIWDEFREKFSTTWESIKNGFKGEDGEGNSILKSLKAIGLVIENIAVKGALKILNIWDNLMVALADKMQGALAYLSTIHIEPKWEDGKLKFNVSTIKDRMAYSDSDKLYTESSAMGGVGAMVLEGPAEGMGNLIKLGEAMGIHGHGGSALNAAYNPTIGELKAHLRGLRAQGLEYIPYEYLKAAGTPIEQIGLDDASIDAFIQNVKGSESAKSSWEKAAVAFATPQREGMIYNKKPIYDKTGVGAMARQWVGDVEDVAGTLASSIINDNYARVDLWFRNDTGKKAMIGADSKGTVFSKDIVLLQQMVPEGMKLVVDQIK